jgi:hypothetical protein
VSKAQKFCTASLDWRKQNESRPSSMKFSRKERIVGDKRERELNVSELRVFQRDHQSLAAQQVEPKHKLSGWSEQLAGAGALHAAMQHSVQLARRALPGGIRNRAATGAAAHPLVPSASVAGDREFGACLVLRALRPSL